MKGNKDGSVCHMRHRSNEFQEPTISISKLIRGRRATEDRKALTREKSSSNGSKGAGRKSVMRRRMESITRKMIATAEISSNDSAE